jgi:hypothetical protein
MEIGKKMGMEKGMEMRKEWSWDGDVYGEGYGTEMRRRVWR